MGNPSGERAFPDHPGLLARLPLSSPLAPAILGHVFPEVNTRDPGAVLESVLAIVGSGLDAQGLEAVQGTHRWFAEACAGRACDFEALDTHYHDLEHTMQGFLCLGRWFAGWRGSGRAPMPEPRTLRLALVAILLHDTGYLRRRGIDPGPGGRYTLDHVERGAGFARALLATRGWPAADLDGVAAMIRCTGAGTVPEAGWFASEALHVAGCGVGTADLLGQMAAPDYLDKLPLLHREFAEAIAARPGCVLERLFPTEEALIRQTPDFWEQNVRPRLDSALGGVWRFLSEPWPTGPNSYVGAIEAHIARLRARLQHRRDG